MEAARLVGTLCGGEALKLLLALLCSSARGSRWAISRCRLQ
ncbi:hypothetical protein ACFQH2_16085 [Natronoarchaeum sp. GCM10025703]